MKVSFPNSMPARISWTRLLVPALIALFVLLIHLPLLSPGRFLLTTDDNLGLLAAGKSRLPGAFLGGWNDDALCGFPGFVQVSWTNLLLWWFPALTVANWLHAADLAIGSILLWAFLRRRGCSNAAGLLGALTVYWVGSNFTLIFAGHIAKFAILMLAALYLWLVERMVRDASMAWAICAGGVLGALFLEQQDVALFFAMFLGPYTLFVLWREGRFRFRESLRLLGPLLAVFFLMVAHSLFQGMRHNVVPSGAEDREDSRAQWEFATQWSWPPDESIEFLAPGYLGWRSGEPDGPYWGRMGRSAGWETTRQGFQNFKLEDQYIGAIPIVLALVAFVCACCFRRRPEEEGGRCDAPGRWRADILFWGAAAILALLLSFGKYFPLYSLFYKLPVISSIRNPNKFLQVFQLALGILAAYGLDALLAPGRKDSVT